MNFNNNFNSSLINNANSNGSDNFDCSSVNGNSNNNDNSNTSGNNNYFNNNNYKFYRRAKGYKCQKYIFYHISLFI